MSSTPQGSVGEDDSVPEDDGLQSNVIKQNNSGNELARASQDGEIQEGQCSTGYASPAEDRGSQEV